MRPCAARAVWIVLAITALASCAVFAGCASSASGPPFDVVLEAAADTAVAAQRASDGRPPEGLLLIAHGYGNNPSHWPARLVDRIRGGHPGAGEWAIYAHDWERNANRPLTAARRGYSIGGELARGVLAAGDEYPVIHLVGQSLGAHLTQGFLDVYRAEGGQALVHLTLLDPFLIRGVLGFGWGVRDFGRGADFAENYYVRDRRAIGTNRPVRHAHNFDTTELVPQEMWGDVIGPHWWVVEHYRQSVGLPGPGFGLSPLARLESGPHRDPRTAIRALGRAYPAGEVTRLGAGQLIESSAPFSIARTSAEIQRDPGASSTIVWSASTVM